MTYRSVQNVLSASLFPVITIIIIIIIIKLNVYRILNFPVVLCGCETWSFIFKKEDELRTFANKVLGKLFEPKKDQTTADWEKFHSERFCDVHFSSNINEVIKSRIMRWAVYVARVNFT